MFMLCSFVNMAIKHKHLKLDQTKLTRARRILKLGTERETVEHALDLVLIEAQLIGALRAVGGIGGMVDIFDE